MTHKKNHLESNDALHEYSTLIDKIRKMPEIMPPPALSHQLIERLAPIKRSWFKRLYRFLMVPKIVTITPMKLAGAMICLMAALSTAIIYIPKNNSVHVNKQNKLVTLRFVLEHPDAQKVQLIGTFNHWRPDFHEMHREDSHWVLNLQVPPGRYEYAFLINGKSVIADPNASFRQLDGFGSYNSIIFATKDEKKIL